MSANGTTDLTTVAPGVAARGDAGAPRPRVSRWRGAVRVMPAILTAWLGASAVAVAVAVAAVAVAAAAPAGPTNGSHSTSTVFVDRAWAGAPAGAAVAPGRFSRANAFATIQAAVDAAPPGGTVNVAPGTYVEQVVIDGKDLTLTGAGAGVTTIVSPAVLTVSFTAGSFTNKPVLLCRNAADIRITDLTIDGDGQGNVNNRFVGVAYFNAGGYVSGVDIVRVRNASIDNVQHGFGLYCQNTGGGPYGLELENVSVSDFQKNGMLLNGAGMTVDVHDCAIAGSGDLTVIAQNGIQLGLGAGGSIRDCALSDLRYVPAIAVSGAILVFQPGSPVALSGFTGVNAFSNVQSPIRWYDGSGSIDGVEMTGPIVDGEDFGAISISNFSGPSAPLAAMPAASPPGLRPAAPVIDDAGAGFGAQRTMAAHSVALSGLCISGDDISGTTGLYVYSTGGPLLASLAGSLIHDWDYGIRVVGNATSVNVTNSSIASNLTAGLDNLGSSAAQSAASNWWGAASGPSGVGPGTGDPITAANVDFSPWLLSGTNTASGCGFSAAPEQITPIAIAPCVSTTSPCITVDVTIARNTMLDVRGFSVPVQLSPNLQLCAGPSSITEGTYLSSTGTTLFQVQDHGGGAYTVDGVILGAPCGATAPAGTLFSLQVSKAPGPDGAGSVTIGTPLLRDCANVTVPAAAGGPAAITIDTAGPLAIGDAAASQLKTGNDTDGTTKVLVTFTPPGDAVSVEVYRAGFGNYPEYDDPPGGGVPALPAYPPGAPWSATGITASGQADEIAQRDFWYYVVFTKDACGNVSAVSNRTDGTLNYHLGDVSNGFTAGQGNNRVLAEDISLLGSHYPALLTAGDPFAYLDVGPTTDLSVNARPTTDNQVNFEDLIVFALNYNLVSAPLSTAAAESQFENALTLDVRDLPAPGATFDVTLRLTGGGDVHGLSLVLGWDAAVVEPVGIARGALLDRQSRDVVFLPAGDGALDLALLGPGSGLEGSGEIARVTFRALATGEPGIVLDRVVARDGNNRPVSFEANADDVRSPTLPARTAFGTVGPNPSRGSLIIEFALARTGPAKLTVFDLSGRRVRTLLDEPLTPGTQRIAWNGRDDAGRRVSAGFYVLRLDAGGATATRRITIVR